MINLIKIAICEDEDFFLEKIYESTTKYIENKNLIANISTFELGEDLLATNNHFDIILLDIKLGTMNGMEVAKQINASGFKSNIIFITSCEEYSLQAFDVNAVHFLVKPISDEKLHVALERAIKRLAKEKNDTLTINKGSEVEVIYICDILYIEVMDHKIHIKTLHDDYYYIGKLSTLEERLDECFFRCHRSYIVNLNFIVKKDQYTVMVKGGDMIFISRRNSKELTDRLLKFFKNEVM